MWHEVIFPRCTGILFLAGRISFCNTNGTATPSTFGPSCLVAFGREAWRRLVRAPLAGHLVGVYPRGGNGGS